MMALTKSKRKFWLWHVKRAHWQLSCSFCSSAREQRSPSFFRWISAKGRPLFRGPEGGESIRYLTTVSRHSWSSRSICTSESRL